MLSAHRGDRARHVMSPMPLPLPAITIMQPAPTGALSLSEQRHLSKRNDSSGVFTSPTVSGRAPGKRLVLIADITCKNERYSYQKC